MIDQEKGLSTLMNNKTIYFNVLKRFYNRYNDTKKLYAYLENQDYNELYFEIHTIKGLSLNLGAVNLHSLSVTLNDQYKTETLVDVKLVKQFLIELNTVIKEIKNIIDID